MPDFSPMLAHGVLVAAVAVLCCTSRVALLCLLIVTANWLACSAYVLATGDYDPLIARFVFDFIAGWTLYFLPGAGRWRGVIMLIYAAQMAAHMGYYLSGSADPDSYSTFLSVTSRLQLLLIGGWGCADLWRRFVHDGRLAALLLGKSRNIGAMRETIDG